MLELKEDKHKVSKAEGLLREHKAQIIEELGPSAFDLLSPAQARKLLGLEYPKKEDKRKREHVIPELTRQGWLEPVQDQDIGAAHLYYRWRVEFVKRFRRPYKNPSQTA